jgi:hypothetical protein
MTTNELIQFYSDLLIMQFRGKPKAVAHIKALVGISVMDQLPLLVQAGYEIETAVGVQLDVIGKYVGVTRSAVILSGNITLSDADFRQLIKLAIATNNLHSSLYDIQSYIKTWFPTAILVFDYLGMRMSYYLSTSLGSQNLAQMIVVKGLLPRPMGVQLGATIYAGNITNFFGMRSYLLAGSNISPFNTYTSYSMTSPWLSYANAF